MGRETLASRALALARHLLFLRLYKLNLSYKDRNEATLPKHCSPGLVSDVSLTLSGWTTGRRDNSKSCEFLCEQNRTLRLLFRPQPTTAGPPLYQLHIQLLLACQQSLPGTWSRALLLIQVMETWTVRSKLGLLYSLAWKLHKRGLPYLISINSDSPRTLGLCQRLRAICLFPIPHLGMSFNF